MSLSALAVQRLSNLAKSIIRLCFSPGGPLSTDSVEKVALLFGLGQNHSIGQRENTQHDGTVIEWAGAAVLLVQH